MKLIVRGTDGLTRSYLIAKDKPPLGVLSELEGIKAELIDEDAVCFRRAEYQMNGKGWICVMDRSGRDGPRPESTELARDLPIDSSIMLAELTRRERRFKGKPFPLPDWQSVVIFLTEDGYIEVTDQGGKLTGRGRAVGMDLIDRGY